MVQIKTVKSPCVGVCSTGIGDSVCRGCKRFMHEIIDWNGFSDAEQQAVIGRLSSLIRQVAEPVVEIQDVEQFRQALIYQNVRFDEAAGPYLWLLELLKVGASTIESLEAYACRVKPPYTDWPLVKIRDQIDKDFYTLSEVHYERYFSARITKS